MCWKPPAPLLLVTTSTARPNAHTSPGRRWAARHGIGWRRTILVDKNAKVSFCCGVLVTADFQSSKLTNAKSGRCRQTSRRTCCRRSRTRPGCGRNGGEQGRRRPLFFNVRAPRPSAAEIACCRCSHARFSKATAASVLAGTLSWWSQAASREMAAPPAVLQAIRVTLSVYNCIRRFFHLQHCSKILEDDSAARGCHRRQYPESAIQPRRASAAQGSPGRRCRRSACRASIDVGCLARR